MSANLRDSVGFGHFRPRMDGAVTSSDDTTSRSTEDSASDITSESRAAHAPRASPRSGLRRYAFVTAGVVIIIAVMVILAYVLTGGFHHNSSSSASAKLLIPRGETDSLPAGQFAGITLILNTTALLQGLFFNSFGITLYTMPLSQFHTLVLWDNVTNITNYEWTSGRIANGVYYTLDVSLPVGTWVFAFVNPSPWGPTGITFDSNVTLSPT